MPQCDDTVAAAVSSTSSDATESENSSSNDHFDYDNNKTTNSLMLRNSLPAASTVSCTSSEIDLQHVSQSFGPPDYDFVVNPEFIVECNDDATLTTQRTKIYCDQRSDIPAASTIARSTKASVSRSRTNSRYSGESQDQLNITRSRRNTRGKSDFDNQHEHYMVPTHEPNCQNDNRTISLFNPEFLPNFNDMLMYVAQPDIDRNIPLTWDNRHDITYNDDLNDSCIEREIFNDADAAQHSSSVDSRFIDTTTTTTTTTISGSPITKRDASYASLHLPDHVNLDHHINEQFKNEKIYEAVVRHDAKRGCKTIEYNC